MIEAADSKSVVDDHCQSDCNLSASAQHNFTPAEVSIRLLIITPRNSCCQANHLPVNTSAQCTVHARRSVHSQIFRHCGACKQCSVLVGEFFEMNTLNMSVILDHYIALK